MTNRTMKKPSKPNDTEKNQSLIQQFKILEKEYESFKESKLRNPRRCSTGSDHSTIVNSFDQFLENSPRSLMSSLQHRRSPSDGFLKVKNWDMGSEEILKERRNAITSGKLKGRRLFEETSEVELDINCDDNEICIDSSSNVIRQNEVVTKENSKVYEKSCLLKEEGFGEEKVVVEGDHVVEIARGGGRCMVAMAWLAFVIILVTLCLIVCNGNMDQNEVILVPT